MLITANDCADLLGILPTDTLLVRLVKSSDAWLKRMLGREFERSVRTEVVRGYGLPYLFVRESPIVAVTEVRIDQTGQGAFPVSTIITDLTLFTFDSDPIRDDPTIRYRDHAFPEGLGAAQIEYEAGFEDDEIPEDIRELIIERVAAKYRQGADEEMQQERQGDRSWVKFAETDKRILGALRRYKR